MKQMLTFAQIKSACKLADEDWERKIKNFWHQCFGRMAAKLDMTENGAHEACNFIRRHEGINSNGDFKRKMGYHDVDQYFSALPFRIIFAGGASKLHPRNTRCGFFIILLRYSNQKGYGEYRR